jgi:hypothetical protein
MDTQQSEKFLNTVMKDAFPSATFQGMIEALNGDGPIDQSLIGDFTRWVGLFNEHIIGPINKPLSLNGSVETTPTVPVGSEATFQPIDPESPTTSSPVKSPVESTQSNVAQKVLDLVKKNKKLEDENIALRAEVDRLQRDLDEIRSALE